MRALLTAAAVAGALWLLARVLPTVILVAVLFAIVVGASHH